MFYEAVVKILLQGAKSQDEACDGVSELLSNCPGFVVDWAYERDEVGNVLLPIPRPDLTGSAYEEGDFLDNEQLGGGSCPFCDGYVLQEKEMYYDRDGYSTLVLECVDCGGQVIVKNIPPGE